LEDPGLAQQVQLFPNPSAGAIQIKLSDPATGQSGMLAVFNAAGQLVWLERVVLPATLDLHHLAAGSYTVKLELNGRIASRTLMLE
jgi:hypothetical protein